MEKSHEQLNMIMRFLRYGRNDRNIDNKHRITQSTKIQVFIRLLILNSGY
jgi:hypothetical protein